MEGRSRVVWSGDLRVVVLAHALDRLGPGNDRVEWSGWHLAGTMGTPLGPPGTSSDIHPSVVSPAAFPLSLPLGRRRGPGSALVRRVVGTSLELSFLLFALYI